MARLKKRKSRRFGSPADVHLRTSKAALGDAVRAARRAWKLTRSGDCSRALDAIETHANAMGEARAHENSVSLSKFSTAYNKTGTIGVKAAVLFRRTCLKRGGK